MILYSADPLVSQRVRPGHRQIRRGWNEYREAFERIPEGGSKCWSFCELVGRMHDGRRLYRCNKGHVFLEAGPRLEFRASRSV